MSMTNLILRADSYKYSHFKLFPQNTTNNFSYVESRGVDSDAPFNKDADIVFFGLQAFILKYLMTPVTMADIDQAEKLILAHGMPFNRADWETIVTEYDGYLPLIIEALPEGTPIRPGIMMANVRASDPRFAWLSSFIETAMLRAIWYPTTVATLSREVKKTIYSYLKETSDDPDGQIPFKLHDFGARGVSSAESAELGGMAHLVNFMGTDTVEALVAAQEFYGVDGAAGFSIPASEHSTITAWGRQGELAAFTNMLETYGGTYPLIACVSDSYDIFEAVGEKWPLLKDRMEQLNTMVVIRPDSGDPVYTVGTILDILEEKFGVTYNSKGYKILNNVRVIQGDGVNPTSIYQILVNMKHKGFSVDNIAFGMGGALLQKVNRDTLKFAQKTSAIEIASNMWLDVYKEPVNEPFKKSKKGRQVTVRGFNTGIIETIPLEQKSSDQYNMLDEAYAWDASIRDARENAVPYVREQTFEDIRARAGVN